MKDAEGQNLILNDIFVSVDMKVISTKRTTVKIDLLHWNMPVVWLPFLGSKIIIEVENCGKQRSPQGKQNLRVTCPMGKVEFRYFLSPDTWRLHTRLCSFVRNISTNISALGQRTHLKLGELSSLFIVCNITIFGLCPLHSFWFYFLLRDSAHTLLCEPQVSYWPKWYIVPFQKISILLL